MRKFLTWVAVLVLLGFAALWAYANLFADSGSLETAEDGTVVVEAAAPPLPEAAPELPAGPTVDPNATAGLPNGPIPYDQLNGKGPAAPAPKPAEPGNENVFY
ncbi:MAG TPA: hypothetical protein VD929_04685 [Caulobacteraceae bacterium]|nr:hypothetical protein [Caulobacteraceae bacterium]